MQHLCTKNYWYCVRLVELFENAIEIQFLRHGIILLAACIALCNCTVCLEKRDQNVLFCNISYKTPHVVEFLFYKM